MCSEHKYLTFIRTVSSKCRLIILIGSFLFSSRAMDANPKLDRWSLSEEMHTSVMRGENLELILHKPHIFDRMSDTSATGTTTALHMARVRQPVGEQCEPSDNKNGLDKEDLSHLVPLSQVPPCDHGS